MKGYRTIAVNILALIFTLLGLQGFEISVEEQGYISTGILAMINIGMRFITNTPVGAKEPPSPVANKQSGFVKLKMLILMALLSIGLLNVSGCSMLQEKPWQPFADCANIVELDRKTLGACFVSAKILANNIDAAADAAIISSEQEIALLDKLERAVELLSLTKTLISEDIESASERLKLAQVILAELVKQAPKPE